jgi:secreted PhoX family phosphatase
VSGKLAAGGRLQALAIDGLPDSRNRTATAFAPASWQKVRWIDLDNPESPADDLRKRGAQLGATLFARGEGIHMGSGELYFCCTSGGAARLGQVFRLRPARDQLQLFFESTSAEQFNYGDNLTVAPNGHLVVCEDQYTPVVDNHLRGIAPTGEAYKLARLRTQTELAGACFSPDGKVLFLNVFSPTATLAITGPWL